MKKLQAKIKKNQTTLLIILLTLLTASLVLIALAPQKSILKPPPDEKKPAVSLAQTTLSFIDTTPQGSEVKTVDVVMQTGSNQITGVQMEIAFDPAAISNVDVVAGDFIASPVELLKKIDYDNGRITYVIGISIGSDAVKGEGTVARVSFTPTLLQGEISLKFLSKTMVSSLGFPQTALKQTSDFTYSVGGPSIIPTTPITDQ